jgi:hypothetical protein
MMVQALLLLPRLVVTPPARLVVAPPHCAAVRRFNAPGVQLGEDGGRPARGAEQLLAAVGNAQARGGSVQMCSATRDSDREKLLAAVQQNGHALFYASAELKADREVVLAAVQQTGRALVYASAELKADREVVLAAVQQNGRALCFASAELKADVSRGGANLAQTCAPLLPLVPHTVSDPPMAGMPSAKDTKDELTKLRVELRTAEKTITELTATVEGEKGRTAAAVSVAVAELTTKHAQELTNKYQEGANFAMQLLNRS